MEVEFRRTGDRRYAVRLIRAGHPALEMNPAPGFDARMPHDLVHLVVEHELGLRHGIFGQLAAGGTAGTFHAIASTEVSSREAARVLRALAKRGEKLLREGLADSVRSEQAAEICRRAWVGRRRGDEAPAGGGAVSAEQLARICGRLDELSAEWTRLQIGHGLTLHWPEVGTKSRRRASARPN